MEGWNEDIWYDVMETLDELARVQYELKNCVKGAYTYCETDEQLADHIKKLAEKLAEQVEYIG